jgi:putative ABC transport system permease protein
MNNVPPRRALRFLRWFCRKDYIDEIEGDLLELYYKELPETPRSARWKLAARVLKHFRPEFIRSFGNQNSLNPWGMYKSHFKVGWRNLFRNKVYSFINIGGLAMGMAVALLIGLWIYDETKFNTSHQNYDRIAKVMHRATFDGEVGASPWLGFPVGPELSANYADDFEHVVMSTFLQDHIVAYGDEKFNQTGYYMQEGAPDMLTLNMVKGTRAGLKDMNSIMLSASVAAALFGDDDPINKVVRMDDRHDVKVTGVYQDLPRNSAFHEMTFLAPWELYIADNRGWLERFFTSWMDGMIQIFVQVREGADLAQVDDKIKLTVYNRVTDALKIHHYEIFLHPMPKWHLYEKFENGYSSGGQIQFVWLFGIIGIFVLLLACINFMNLSTARSERRAKEVGIRKAIGSVRKQLVTQFFAESILITILAFVLALGVVLVLLPAFNDIANKQISIPAANVWFWLCCMAFVLLTGLVAGSYPALYLSSFQAIKALKGTFRFGRFASLPRKVLVVLQFAVSVTLIIGTMIVYRQVQYTMDRETGYDRAQLIYLNMKTPGINKHFTTVRNELISAGAIIDMAESSAPASQNYGANFGGFEWNGKPQGMVDVFGVTWVTPEYGKTVGWQIVEGRDYSRYIPADQQAMVINESAVEYMGLKNPIGEVVKLEGHPFTIIGVVKDLLVGSPYEPTRPAIYSPMTWVGNILSIRLNPARPTAESLAKIQAAFRTYEPAMPFDYKFVDEQYAQKFNNEVRVGKLAFLFAGLAIMISCLGLFGLASFVAEQRTKEIGIRKVVGASVFSLWTMLSRDFVVLVIVACAVAVPVAYYLMKQWLGAYTYHAEMSWWIFAMTIGGALVLTLLTVSYQAIAAALMNPVKSLRTE